jgi:hypothetical protein
VPFTNSRATVRDKVTDTAYKNLKKIKLKYEKKETKLTLKHAKE